MSRPLQQPRKICKFHMTVLWSDYDIQYLLILHYQRLTSMSCVVWKDFICELHCWKFQLLVQGAVTALWQWMRSIYGFILFFCILLAKQGAPEVTSLELDEESILIMLASYSGIHQKFASTVVRGKVRYLNIFALHQLLYVDDSVLELY